ncbi:hypothetical protein HQ32_01493 [Prauserella sp. Am3]|nr:hypothetical protein HQ32_01493 [Prauserella sp. Am3]
MKFMNIGIADISGLRACAGLRTADAVHRDRRRTAVSLNERHLGARVARVGAPTRIPAVAGTPAGAEVRVDVSTGDSTIRPPYVQLRRLQGKSRVPLCSPERHRLAIA